MKSTTPYGTPSAVMLLMFRVRNGVREVLLQHRHNVALLNNLWDTAATGHVERDESMRQAVCREALEELGIVVKPEDLIFRGLAHVRVRPGYTYYNGYFEAVRWQGTPAIMERDKCDGLAWFPLDALPPDMIPERRRMVLDTGRGVYYDEVGFEGVPAPEPAQDARRVQMKRVYNFSAGPSMLPLKVLEQAAEELVNYADTGMSVMEMSHRSKEYEAIIQAAERGLRQLMDIPDNYRVLFLQGGATTQFAAVCYNLLTKSGKADYVVTGMFSKKALEEARKYGDIVEVASSKDLNHTYIPKLTRQDFRPDADYVHICLNNTIFGTRWDALPDTGDIPLVADISSCILSEPLNVSDFGVLYAGAQKNVAPAGLTLVIVRDDLLGHARPDTPALFNWQLMADNQSMYNTPPTYPIYMAKLVFDYLREDIGGLERMGEINRRKAGVLYDWLDGQDYYTAPAEKSARSIMNVVFKTGDAALDKLFAQEAAEAGLKNLAGHRSAGGMRASIYNAMPEEGIHALVAFMEAFAARHPKP